MKNRFKTMAAVILLAAVLSLSGCGDRQIQAAADQSPQASYEQLSDIPEFYGEPYVTLSGNAPDFSPEDMAADSFKNYSQLDSLGRCGQAYAMISTKTMPTAKRESIGQIKPSGWHTVRYDDLIQMCIRDRDILEATGYRTVKIQQDKLININTPEDYIKYGKRR